MRTLTLTALLSLGIMSACGDKDDTGVDGTVSDGGSDDGGSDDGGSDDGGSDDGGSDDGGSDDGGAADDIDGDGYTADEGDCDDEDASVHPDAPDEPYDGIDSDCDGASDFDWDGDGYDSSDYGGEDCDDADETINPDAEDTPYDGLDTDCDGWSDWDADRDGHDADLYGGDDCDDDDDSVVPGGYDTPNDGIDQDCDGEDRVFDGVVVTEGGRATWTYSYDLTGSDQVDVTVLMDTTCSMSGVLSTLDMSSVAASVDAGDADLSWGFATFDDYAYSSYGSSGTDKPFTLEIQQTDDIDAVQDTIESTSLHNGSDGPESSIEALYQSLSGAGYDQDCDGDYDTNADVLPFLASDDDPFGGDAGEAYDSSLSGTGTLGGMGFRDGATPILFYVTDNYLRDPDAGYGTPGGCPGDAGSSDVVAAASELGAWVLGMCTSAICTSQMETLAEDGGWMLDLDGDGEDDPLAYEISASTMNDAIAVALDQVISTLDLSAVYSEVALEVVTDGYGLVLDIDPDPAEDIDTSVTDSVDFTVTFYGAVPATTEALVVTVTFQIVLDGEVAETVSVDVEIPPA